MLSQIITKVNERIFGILLEGEASLSEIARDSNTSKANISRSLRMLERNDLVRKEIRGRTHLYRFNHLHSQALEIETQSQEERKRAYNQRMNGLPARLNSLLENILKDKYQGCIFFGSSLAGSFRDIDVFVMVKDVKKDILVKEIKMINSKISPVIGTRKELEIGVGQEDMLYRNISKGIAFNCEDFILSMRRRPYYLRRKDIQERFILGYREILSGMEFSEKGYAKKHLEKGIMDITYAALNYSDVFPENDSQAMKMFKKQFGFWFSNSAKTAKSQAEKLGAVFL